MRADSLAPMFEQRRDRLRGLAHRMLGATAQAEDVVQDAWLRLADTDAVITDLDGWLTTVVSRLCLDLLRARARRPQTRTDELEIPAADADPEAQAVHADSVERALLVVLDALGPEERVAFVLHDLFAVPFAEIGPILRRTPATTKKLASRARQRVHAPAAMSTADLAEQRAAVAAFLRAARGGDLVALLEILAPDVVRTADPATLTPGMVAVVRGARAVAEGAVALRRRAREAVVVLVDGRPGLVLTRAGRPIFVLTFGVHAGRITAYDVFATPERFTLSLLTS
ncbi:sigma-70 family RNA polymerase sigma factor [Nocardia caishijiensis]|uniref:RNA polymerase sigma-70 factor (ECF subfamily) n=1 Tax=Nocardia caishijiensis TaxID=184756 RepID=A0ABQ6YLW1_9NOCA|nr:sigma-70 family RNA polymerase sigma factor [Nocardia caishijiensis]KAF0846774.1 RNA polymerase sigma-70 factor (ECF subfamily) [Nocardia caishijiensis]